MSFELRAVNIPEPVLKMGSHGKVYPVLGQKGVIHEGHITAEAGSGVSGMVFYVYECYGDEAWDPRVKDGKILGALQCEMYSAEKRSAISSSVRKDLIVSKNLSPILRTFRMLWKSSPNEG